MEALVTLCEECHKDETENRPGEEKALLHALREKFFSADLNSLAIGFHSMPLLLVPEVIAPVYEWALKTSEVQQELIDKYFAYLDAKAKKKGKDPNGSR